MLLGHPGHSQFVTVGLTSKDETLMTMVIRYLLSARIGGIKKSTYSSTDIDNVTPADKMASTIHPTQATVAAQDPQAGTHTYIHMLTSVAKPMGIVPKNKEFMGSRIMTPHISGYRVYLRMEIAKAEKKRIVFKAKKMIER